MITLRRTRNHQNPRNALRDPLKNIKLPTTSNVAITHQSLFSLNERKLIRRYNSFYNPNRKTHRGKLKYTRHECRRVKPIVCFAREAHASFSANGTNIKVAYVETHNRKETYIDWRATNYFHAGGIYSSKHLEELDVQVVLLFQFWSSHYRWTGTHKYSWQQKRKKRWQDVLCWKLAALM